MAMSLMFLLGAWGREHGVQISWLEARSRERDLVAWRREQGAGLGFEGAHEGKNHPTLFLQSRQQGLRFSDFQPPLSRKDHQNVGDLKNRTTRSVQEVGEVSLGD